MTEFRCINCGNQVERNLMPWKHAVLGSVRTLNQEASCCEDPEYEDLEEVLEEKPGNLLGRSVPGFA